LTHVKGAWPLPAPWLRHCPPPSSLTLAKGFGKREGGWRGEGDEGKPDGGQAWRAVGDLAAVEKARPVDVGELHGHGEARGEEGGKTAAELRQSPSTSMVAGGGSDTDEGHPR